MHGFSRKADSAFDKKHAAGIQFANRAIEAGHQSLGELGYRRKGLCVSLGFIALLLIALAMKVRSLG